MNTPAFPAHKRAYKGINEGVHVFGRLLHYRALNGAIRRLYRKANYYYILGMAVSLRQVLDDEMNMETDELITNESLVRQYRKAVHWYRKYRLFPRTNTCKFSIETGDWVPDIDMDQKVEYEGKTVKLSEIIDTETRVFNGTGSIKVTIALTSDNAYLAGLPHELECLFVAYCKLAIGQKLKFSSYQNQPFELDGESIYAEGEAGKKEWEDFIMINRDEDPANITDLRKEPYKGIITRTTLTRGGIVLW